MGFSFYPMTKILQIPLKTESAAVEVNQISPKNQLLFTVENVTPIETRGRNVRGNLFFSFSEWSPWKRQMKTGLKRERTPRAEPELKVQSGAV